MKKEALQEIILATIGGIIFSLGMCMCLIEEWQMLKEGIITGTIGVVILLCIILVHKKAHPKKKITKNINWEVIVTWTIGVVGALIMGYGMSKIMVTSVTKTDMIIGLITGIIGLIICILNYPIYSYIKGNK